MDACELYESWDQIAGTSEQLDGLQELADGIADAWGLEGVTVEFGEVDSDDFGQYDPDTNTITIDLDGISDPDEAFDTVFHESMHASHDQWGLSEAMQEDLHDSLGADAGYLADELVADCVSSDLVESGATTDIPNFPGTIEISGGDASESE